jgi:hypothetical protein
MNKQRLAILIVAGLGVTATFLPWVKAPIIGTINGTMGDGWITLVLFSSPLIISLLNDKTTKIEGGWLYGAIIPSLVAGVIGIWKILYINSIISAIDASVSIEFGLYLLVLSGISLPILAFVVKDNKADTEITTTSKQQDTLNEIPVQNTKTEKELLQELKEKGVITNEEYNSKITELDFNTKLKQITGPIIKTLVESREKGILSEDEFVEKKNNALATETLKLKKWYDERPKMSDIPSEILATLKDYHKAQLKSKLEFMCLDPINAKNYVIALQSDTIKLIDIERWNLIVADGLTDRIKLIYKQNA